MAIRRHAPVGVERRRVLGRPLHAQQPQDGTRFIIDHAGVPREWHDHISTGYPSFYQQPLERYFAALARP